MTNTNDTRTPDVATPTPPHKKNHIRNSAITLLTLIVVAGFGDALYEHMKICKQIKTLLVKTDALRLQQTNTSAQLDSTIATLLSAQTRLDTLKKSVGSALQEHLYQNNDWLLQKARYYLELAEINAHWSDNTSTTIALFQQADNLLINMNESPLLSIRQAIATDIAQLQAIPVLDTAGLLAKLDAIQHTISMFPSKAPLALTKIKTSPDIAVNTPSTWRGHLQRSLDLLKKLVIIRHHNEAIQPLLAPEYETILRENIRFNLQEAQWAVLQKNQAVFDLALTQAIANVSLAFDSNAENVQTLIKQLNALQSTQLKSETPSLGQSLLLLNQFIESKKTPALPVTGEQS